MHQFNKLSDEGKSELVLAAMIDWFKVGGSALSMDGGSFEVLDGFGYVLLRNDDKVQAVYLVQSENSPSERIRLLPQVPLAGKSTLQ